MKNPDDMRLVIAAVTLWILRFAQNDSFHFDHSICKSALVSGLFGRLVWGLFRRAQGIGRAAGSPHRPEFHQLHPGSIRIV